MEYTIRLPEELVSEIEGIALSHGQTLSQWLEEVARAQLQDSRWQLLFAYGRQTAQQSCHTEADVPDLVRAWRRENASNL